MRQVIFIFAILMIGLGFGCNKQPLESGVRAEPGRPEAEPVGNRRPVLIELFTSEGCSSCPPADRNLAFLDQQQPVNKAEIITLAFHVDYWDRLGWKDRFSSPLFSRRQNEYSRVLRLDSSYTPQMVVDGRSEFVGSDSGKAATEITKAVENAKGKIGISVDGGQAKVKIDDVPVHTTATVFAAIAESGLSSRVERGENSGKTLEHVSVVRELKELGTIASGDSKFDGALEIPANKEWKPENLQIVIFVQENEGKKVIGVGRTSLQ